ncbi:uncharacterized protein CLUP02_02417 [Colletotrichum lupini]|uniref:Uncharacterized protein n=1 Tax=Colletotrichum lupini TaxID=145971 RepID=A0A9Q8SGH0_9PEZI|nr:uncharacterized protein CLUP02_02417 [Colletotrichum lupini]UQC76951.1 hypothetical protein CLUP02_02417 [Colletotrichum lupini]
MPSFFTVHCMAAHLTQYAGLPVNCNDCNSTQPTRARKGRAEWGRGGLKVDASSSGNLASLDRSSRQEPRKGESGPPPFRLDIYRYSGHLSARPVHVNKVQKYEYLMNLQFRCPKGLGNDPASCQQRLAQRLRPFLDMLHWLALDAISCNLAIWQLLPWSLSAPVACATLPTSRLPNRQADKSHIPTSNFHPVTNGQACGPQGQAPNPILFRWWHFAPNGSQPSIGVDHQITMTSTLIVLWVTHLLYMTGARHPSHSTALPIAYFDATEY